MKINLDYKRPKKIEEDSVKAGNSLPTYPELTVDYINFAVMDKYEKGLEGKLRRVWGRIQRKLDAAIEESKDEIELEEAEKDFIRGCIKDAKFPPMIARYVQVLEEEIDSWKE